MFVTICLIGAVAKRLDVSDNAVSPGNALTIQFECEYITETFTAVGTRGLPAEKVAENAVSYARKYTESTAAVGQFLADQILLPYALAGSGSFTADEISSHTRTNIDTIKKFLDVNIAVSSEETCHRIDIKSQFAAETNHRIDIKSQFAAETNHRIDIKSQFAAETNHRIDIKSQFAAETNHRIDIKSQFRSGNSC